MAAREGWVEGEVEGPVRSCGRGPSGHLPGSRNSNLPQPNSQEREWQGNTHRLPPGYGNPFTVDLQFRRIMDV